MNIPPDDRDKSDCPGGQEFNLAIVSDPFCDQKAAADFENGTNQSLCCVIHKLFDEFGRDETGK
jgi:hypothetical protein